MHSFLLFWRAHICSLLNYFPFLAFKSHILENSCNLYNYGIDFKNLDKNLYNYEIDLKSLDKTYINISFLELGNEIWNLVSIIRIK